MARAAGLIAIPVGVYVFSFYIHFLILNESGTGDANMSSLFQAGLQGSKLQSSPVDVIFGSVITMKSNSFGGGLLHSHPQVYPSGSKQQQVTTYHHKDENNEWIMVRSHDAQNEEERKEQNEAIEKIHDKQLIRLRHAKTGRHLHSHQIPAPLTAGDLEVSSYGQEGLYDPNDLWELQIVSDPDVKGKRTLKNLLTKLRLKHVSTGCYLKARNVHLPEWGFKQGEVSCEKTQNPEARYFLWNIETNTNEKLPPGNSSLYKSNFWDNLRDCNVGMWITNNALKPDPELEPSLLTSAPKDWFWMSKGIRMAGWDADKVKFYMLGSPAVWPVSSLAILSLLGLLGAWILLRRRQVYHLVPKNWTFNCYQLKFVTGGWALHYLPFYLLGRVLYLHHYYPALLFAILNAGLLFDLATKNLSPKHQQTATLLAIGGVIGTFLYFSPFCYGMAGPIEAFHGRKWMASWNL